MIDKARNPIDPWIFSGGLALMLAGYGLYRLFSPSPHGYLELFIAMPVFCLGLAITGLAFLAERTGKFRGFRIAIGCTLILAAASPFLSIAWLLVQ